VRSPVRSQRFAEEGGVHHLFTVLGELNLDELFSDALTAECLARLLSVINYFQGAEAAPQAYADGKALVKRLLSVLHLS
jgi:hypothetical protein